MKQAGISSWVVRGTAAERQQAERERHYANQRSTADKLGLDWPQPNESRSAGRPPHQDKWIQLLYQSIRENRPIPEGITTTAPAWWRPGDGLEKGEDAAASGGLTALGAETQSSGEQAASPAHGPAGKKRKKTAVEPEVQEWFLDFVEVQKRQKKWNYKQCFDEAKRLAPDLFGDVHYATPFRWKRGAKAPSQAGRPKTLNAGEVTMLTEVAATVAQYFPVGAQTMGFIFAAALRDQGHDWTPSPSWMKDFLRTMGLSYKKPAGDLRADVAEEERVDQQTNLQEKVAFVMKEHPARNGGGGVGFFTIFWIC